MAAEQMKVKWNSRIDGLWSAIAEEEKAGYRKGEEVFVTGTKNPETLPSMVYVTVKNV